MAVFAQVAAQLIQAISSGEIPVGTRLPAEQALAEQFGVSRPTVREALSCLQFEGYVEPRRGSGTVVISQTAAKGGPWATELAGAKRRTVLHLIEARFVIETSAVAMAARDPDPRGLRNLKTIVCGMQLSLSEPKLQPHTDLGVHTALVRVCRNGALVEAAEHLLRSADDGVSRASAWEDSGLPWEWLGHHEEMVSAVLDRDPDRAARACRMHLISVLENVALVTPLSAAEKDRCSRILTAQRRKNAPKAGTSDSGSLGSPSEGFSTDPVLAPALGADKSTT